jgi:predicted transcriptional regulator
MMTPDPITLRPHQTVKEVAQIFREHMIDGAPVVNEEGKIIGLFTKSQVYRVVCQDLNPLTPIEELMTCEVYTGYPADEFADVVILPYPDCR